VEKYRLFWTEKKGYWSLWDACKCCKSIPWEWGW